MPSPDLIQCLCVSAILSVALAVVGLTASAATPGSATRSPIRLKPVQINDPILARTPAGAATVVVRAADGVVSSGTAQVALAPALFAIGGNRQGLPLSLVLRARPDGLLSFSGMPELGVATVSGQGQKIE